MPTRRKLVIALPTLGAEERALLARLLMGHTKLRRFPSLQWSVSGRQFIRSAVPERLVRLGLIEQGDVSSKGVAIYAPTERARTLLESTNVKSADVKKCLGLISDLTKAKPTKTANAFGGSNQLVSKLIEAELH